MFLHLTPDVAAPPLRERALRGKFAAVVVHHPEALRRRGLRLLRPLRLLLTHQLVLFGERRVGGLPLVDGALRHVHLLRRDFDGRGLGVRLQERVLPFPSALRHQPVTSISPSTAKLRSSANPDRRALPTASISASVRASRNNTTADNHAFRQISVPAELPYPNASMALARSSLTSVSVDPEPVPSNEQCYDRPRSPVYAPDSRNKPWPPV